jgi:hypothetical protein
MVGIVEILALCFICEWEYKKIYQNLKNIITEVVN